MILSDWLWAKIRDNFSCEECQIIRDAEIRYSVCPRGQILSDTLLGEALATKITNFKKISIKDL
jgi:hypothetical protein